MEIHIIDQESRQRGKKNVGEEGKKKKKKKFWNETSQSIFSWRPELDVDRVSWETCVNEMNECFMETGEDPK